MGLNQRRAGCGDSLPVVVEVVAVVVVVAKLVGGAKLVMTVAVVAAVAAAVEVIRRCQMPLLATLRLKMKKTTTTTTKLEMPKQWMAVDDGLPVVVVVGTLYDAKLVMTEVLVTAVAAAVEATRRWQVPKMKKKTKKKMVKKKKKMQNLKFRPTMIVVDFVVFDRQRHVAEHLS